MKQLVNQPETWYEASADRGPVQPELTGRVQAEACVIGGGLAGLTTARELQRRGVSTVLLEAKRLGWGASGRNGGFVTPGFAEGIDAVAHRFGLSAAQALFRLSEEGRRYVSEQIAALEPGLRLGSGTLLVWRYADVNGARRHIDLMQQRFDQQLEFVGREELRLLLRTEAYHCAVRNPQGFHIHPLNYVLSLARNSMAQGLRVFENSRVFAVRKEEASFRVVCAEGEVAARHVVVCVSALDRKLHRASGRAVLPVATYMIATESMDQDAIKTGAAISDTRRAGDYYRAGLEGRILWGGRITTRQTEPARLGEMLRRDMISVYPQLGNARVSHAWAGLMGYARHKMPLIGCDRDGIWYATAFGGHGLNTTAMAGLLMARSIAEGDDAYRRFEPFAADWAGGIVGRAAVQGSYWWMRLRDRLDESGRGNSK